MKKVFKKLALVIATVSLFSLAACGGKNDGDKAQFEEVPETEQANVYEAFQASLTAAAPDTILPREFAAKYSGTFTAVHTDSISIELKDLKESANYNVQTLIAPEKTEGENTVPKIFDYRYESVIDSFMGLGSEIISFKKEQSQYITNGQYYQKEVTSADGYTPSESKLKQELTSLQEVSIKAALPPQRMINTLKRVFGEDLTNTKEDCPDFKLMKGKSSNAYQLSFNLYCYKLSDLTNFCGYNTNLSDESLRANYSVSYEIVFTEANRFHSIVTTVKQIEDTEESEAYNKAFSSFEYVETTYVFDTITVEFPDDLNTY